MDDPENSFVCPIGRATMKDLRECLEGQKAAIEVLQREMYPLVILLSQRQAEGAKDNDLVLAPGAGYSLIREPA